jgi:cytochrome c oxidase subunit II
VKARCALLGMALLSLQCTNGNGSDADGSAGIEVIAISARQWAYEPNSIMLQKGVPVILELTSSDVHHGFNLPDLGVRADVLPGKPTRIRVTPDKAGTFSFHCDYYCGSGHEGMEGQIIVE